MSALQDHIDRKRKRAPIVKKAVPGKKKLKAAADAYHSSSEDEDEEEEDDLDLQNGGVTEFVEDNEGVDGGVALDSRPIADLVSAEQQEKENDDDDDDDDDDENLDDDALPSDDDEEEEDEEESASDSASDSAASTTPSHARTKPKRHDPSIFASSISHILTSKLTTTKRTDPVLSRSAAASQVSTSRADALLEARAHRTLKSQRTVAHDKHRVRDVLGLQTPEISTAAVMEAETHLRKTAQRGVVKLFNAFRQAQLGAENAERAARGEGVVGMEKRAERVAEMSKRGFLDLLVDGDAKS